MSKWARPDGPVHQPVRKIMGQVICVWTRQPDRTWPTWPTSPPCQKWANMLNPWPVLGFYFPSPTRFNSLFSFSSFLFSIQAQHELTHLHLLLFVRPRQHHLHSSLQPPCFIVSIRDETFCTHLHLLPCLRPQQHHLHRR